MERFSQKKIILLTLGLFTSAFLTTSKVNAGSFGAEIFCTMRDGGNDHESSWDAAYTYIKKQKGGFFKVSPKQAAAQITESVIREKEEERKNKEAKDRENKRKKLEKELEETNQEFSDETLDRYSY